MQYVPTTSAEGTSEAGREGAVLIIFVFRAGLATEDGAARVVRATGRRGGSRQVRVRQMQRCQDVRPAFTSRRFVCCPQG